MPARRLVGHGLLLAMLLCMGMPVQAQCLSYGSTVHLVGTVLKRSFFGPPGYGENPKTDRRETQAILVLDHAVCVTAGEAAGDEAESAQRELTLVPGEGVSLGPLSARRVAVRGELFHAFTAHHHTKLLIQVADTKVVQR